VAVCIRVLKDLRASQCWKSCDDAKNEWSYVAEKDCPATGVTGPGRRLPPCPLYRPELRPVTARKDFRRLLTPSSGAVTGVSSRGDQSHPPARAPCRPPCPPCVGVLRGGVRTSPVGAARRRRAASAAVAEAAPLSPPDAPLSTATWLYVPPCALAAIEPAGVPSVNASSSAPTP